jgi:hypothetical protein
MRVRDDFTLYRRKLGSGIAVFYYQCYDTDGKKLCGHSTGKTTKTEARKECIRLLTAGLLIQEKQKISTFAEYAENWWDWETCEYLKSQKGRKDITKAYADNFKAMIKNQALPFFGKIPLDKITTEDINTWLLGFKDRPARIVRETLLLPEPAAGDGAEKTKSEDTPVIKKTKGKAAGRLTGK